MLETKILGELGRDLNAMNRRLKDLEARGLLTDDPPKPNHVALINFIVGGLLFITGLLTLPLDAMSIFFLATGTLFIIIGVIIKIYHKKNPETSKKTI